MESPPDPEYCAESNATEILGVTGAMMAMALVTCGARFIVRATMMKSYGADDHIMMAALLCAIATFICFVGEVNHANAVGRHFPCITPSQHELFAKWQYVHSLVVMWGVILVKISIALFLMRLVPPGRNWKVFLWATIVFLVCFMLACTGTLVFQCWPIRAVWTFQFEYCFSNATFAAIGLTNTSINCATDFLLATLPVPVIIRLHVNKRTKMTLALILSVGYFACAAGIVKAVKQATFFDETDPLWHNSFNVWNMIELCVGITAASLPGLRPLFAKILASTKSVFSHSWGSNDRTVANNSSSSGSHHRHNHNDQRRGNFKFRAGISLLDMSNISGGGGGGGETSKSKSPPRPQRPSRSNHMDDDDDEENGLFQVDPKRYTVAVTASARDPGDDGNWGGDDLESPARSDSQERLTRPTPAHTCIYKTTEVSQTSLLRR